MLIQFNPDVIHVSVISKETDSGCRFSSNNEVVGEYRENNISVKYQLFLMFA